MSNILMKLQIEYFKTSAALLPFFKCRP